MFKLNVSQCRVRESMDKTNSLDLTVSLVPELKTILESPDPDTPWRQRRHKHWTQLRSDAPTQTGLKGFFKNVEFTNQAVVTTTECNWTDRQINTSCGCCQSYIYNSCFSLLVPAVWPPVFEQEDVKLTFMSEFLLFFLLVSTRRVVPVLKTSFTPTFTHWKHTQQKPLNTF